STPGATACCAARTPRRCPPIGDSWAAATFPPPIATWPAGVASPSTGRCLQRRIWNNTGRFRRNSSINGTLRNFPACRQSHRATARILAMTAHTTSYPLVASNLPVPSALGSLDAYIGAVHQIPVLSVEEEQALARRFHDEQDLDAARELVMSHLRFVEIGRAHG